MTKPTNTDDFKNSAIKVNPDMLPGNEAFVSKVEAPSISPADQAQFVSAAKDQKKRDSKTGQRFGLSHHGL